MKANELRIGNYMNFYSARLDSNFEWKVTEHTIFNIAQGITLENGLDEFSISPIPLTEEWLVRFGLLNNDLGIWNNGDAIYFDYGIERSIELNYVHQLQNLYFALTGEELKLNDK